MTIRATDAMPPPAFTLIDILVSIAVIALLLAILQPGLAAGRVAGRNAACLSHLRQTALAVGVYRARPGMPWPADWIDFDPDGRLYLTRCPANTERSPYLYGLKYEGKDVAPMTVDSLNPTLVRIVVDGPLYDGGVVFWHGWLNAAFLDGHARREQRP